MSTALANPIPEASTIRSWANENKVPVGSRGRLGPVAKTAFFKAHPSVAREVAAASGIEVSKRGRISDETIEAVCNVLP